jgi:sugar O-acyltransferase (sialic acid O-acetyltransferase NeuD family)
MNRYAVYGASGFGREVMPVLRAQLSAMGSDARDLVFIEDRPTRTEVNGHPVLTYEQWLGQPARTRHVAIAIASSSVRERLARRCETDGVGFVDIRASNVVVLDDVVVGPGAILAPFVTLTSNVRIGRHFHANIYSYVAHDCVIGDYVTFAPGVKCNGNVVVEDHAYVGTGAILRQGKPGEPLVIGRGAVVGMGAIVTKNVTPGTTVVGNPARRMAARN